MEDDIQSDHGRMTKTKGFATTGNLAHLLESKTTKTSFGKLPLSTESSAPMFGFGSSGRFPPKSLFQDKDMIAHMMGRTSAGPNYEVTDQFDFRRTSSAVFGTSKRQPLDTRTRYEYYTNVEMLDQPDKADLTRRKRCLAPKFGTGPRLVTEKREGTPGPQYLVGDRPEVKKSSRFTFGHRRENFESPLVAKVSTPSLVGPGRYRSEDCKMTSNKTTSPTYSMTKSSRIPKSRLTREKNQTYYLYSSFGKQTASGRKTSGNSHFGSGGRNARTGHFRDMMYSASTGKLSMPHV